MITLSSLRQWHWMIISLALGAIVGYVRQSTDGDLGLRYGRFIRDQRTFELALLESEQGRPRFADLRVHRQRISDGKDGQTLVYVVSGNYFDGYHEHSGGKLIANYAPAFFVSSATTPFKPVGNWTGIRAETRRQFEALGNPTVVDFLDAVGRSRGFSYHYDWWVGLSIWSWMAVSFLAMGVVWPICLNLVFYRSLRRPREPKGVDLSKIRNPVAPKTTPSAHAVNLDQQESELEKQLHARPAPVETTPPAKQVIPLATQPMAAPSGDVDRDSPEFGQKKDDYYPTAKRQLEQARQSGDRRASAPPTLSASARPPGPTPSS